MHVRVGRSKMIRKIDKHRVKSNLLAVINNKQAQRIFKPAGGTQRNACVSVCVGSVISSDTHIYIIYNFPFVCVWLLSGIYNKAANSIGAPTYTTGTYELANTGSHNLKILENCLSGAYIGVLCRYQAAIALLHAHWLQLLVVPSEFCKSVNLVKISAYCEF